MTENTAMHCEIATFDIAAFCRLAAEAAGAKLCGQRFPRRSLRQWPRRHREISYISCFHSSFCGVNSIGFPIPRVLTWTSRAESSDVGTEWKKHLDVSSLTFAKIFLGMYEQGVFAKTLGECEHNLPDLPFTHYGNLYYKNDVPVPLRVPTLLEGFPLTTS